MPPAWEFEFLVKVTDREGWVQSWSWTGTCADARYRMSAYQGDEQFITGIVAVASAQPYEADALVDATRAARDLCNVLTVGVGGVMFTPVLPPANRHALAGAKSHGPVGITASVTFQATNDVSGYGDKLMAAQRMTLDPVLRADSDTFLVASREQDDAARAISLYRLYEGYARACLQEEPPLLTAAQSAEMTTAALQAGPGGTSAESDRLRSAILDKLSRIHRRPRGVVLAEHFSDLLCRRVDPATVRRLDQLRGRVAHTATATDTVLDAEAMQLLFDVVWTRLKADLMVG